MRMKNIFMLLIFTFVLILAACSEAPGSNAGASGSDNGDSGEASYEISFGHAAALDHFGHDSAMKFKELVEEKSNGQISVEVFGNGTVGGEREMIEAVQLGNLTMMFPSSSVLVPFEPKMAVWDLFYLFPDAATAHNVLDGEVGQAVLDSLSDKGLKGLVYWENGFRHLTNNKRPVETMEDMNGIKIRTLESPKQVDAWNATGANATPIAFTELYAALQQGTVEAQETPLSLMYSMKFFEVQDYLTLTGHLYSPWPVVINQDFWNSLPEDLQAVVMEAAEEARDYNRQLSAEDEAASLDLLVEAGMEYVELSDEELQEFQDAMSVGYEDVKEELGEELYNKLMEEVGK